jgi:transposase InsO family protein
MRKVVIKGDHDSKMAGHFGQDKTLELIRRNFFWPGMDAWIKEWVGACHVCQKNKSPRHTRFGLLQPLETPYSPWRSISMDFITDLPLSDGCSSIWVIVDRFTKMAHFIPLKSDKKKTVDLAKIFLRDIWRLHGLPESIVSDRDSRFTSTFWRDLMSLLNLSRKMSTAYHPQTDGQTERLNQTIEQYIRCYCNFEQNDWESMLAMAEFAYNNSLTAGTGLSPFYANYGFHPRCNWPVQAIVHNPAARLYSRWIDRVHIACEEGLAAARSAMRTYYDKHSQPSPKYKLGDLVMLNGKNLKVKRATRKFAPIMHGPFKINRILQNNNRAVGLALPNTWHIHPVFHVSLLEPFKVSTLREQDVIRPDQVLDMEEEVEQMYSDAYEVDKIVRRRKDEETGDMWYTVRWKGFPDVTDMTEEPAHHLPTDIVAEFNKCFPEDQVAADQNAVMKALQEAETNDVERADTPPVPQRQNKRKRRRS